LNLLGREVFAPVDTAGAAWVEINFNTMNFENLLTTIRPNTDEDTPETGGSHFLVERRRNPRVSIELPFDYSLFEEGEGRRGILADASEGGLLVHLLERVERGELVRMEILFSRGTELITIAVIAKVIWSETAAKESWARYRYGLQFLSFRRGDVEKLKVLLKEVSQRH
jgi:hypothetical protein